MLFILGFLSIFVLGGLTGVMVASVPYDWHVHDTENARQIWERCKLRWALSF